MAEVVAFPTRLDLGTIINIDIRVMKNVIIQKFMLHCKTDIIEDKFIDKLCRQEFCNDYSIKRESNKIILRRVSREFNSFKPIIEIRQAKEYLTVSYRAGRGFEYVLIVFAIFISWIIFMSANQYASYCLCLMVTFVISFIFLMAFAVYVFFDTECKDFKNRLLLHYESLEFLSQEKKWSFA